MSDSTDYTEWLGKDVFDVNGDKIGSIGTLYAEDDEPHSKPTWATVKAGMFGSKESFFPMKLAEMGEDGLMLDVEKDKVKDAPNIDADEQMSPDEEEKLYGYYGLSGGSSSQSEDDDDDMDNNDEEERTVGRDTSGPTTDDAMTRSEEELVVDKEHRQSGRARLRKYVVTENVTTTVRVEREPITDENRGDAMDGREISDEEHEVTLNEEVPVVGTETVPKERVRLDKEAVQDEREVQGEVRKEQTDLDGSDKDR